MCDLYRTKDVFLFGTALGPSIRRFESLKALEDVGPRTGAATATAGAVGGCRWYC